jgi:predicted glycosyltransferase
LFKAVPKIALYAHDGSGFGHLTRISRLAASLQQNCACLVITGSREASWLVAPGCEFVKLPSWESMFQPRATNPNRTLWLDLSKEETVRFRSSLIEKIITIFSPDALIVDYLPYGLRNELLATLLNVRTRKYLLLRGIVDSADYELREILASTDLSAIYDRLLIAADRRVVEPLNDLPLSIAAKAKCEWIGYMTHSGVASQSVRHTHAIARDQIWVVCSAGSGLRGEALFSECIGVAGSHPSVFFDVVLGTRSTLRHTDPCALPNNLRLSQLRTDLPDLHAAADIVITSGGYNSLLEAAAGGAEMIVCPVNRGMKDEQIRHARQLQTFYPLAIADDPVDIGPLLRKAIANALSHRTLRLALETEGIRNARNIIIGDLESALNA